MKKKQAIIIGTGGHSRAVLSILANVNTHNIVGRLDLSLHEPSEQILGIPVIGSIDKIKELDNNSFDIFLAIGDNLRTDIKGANKLNKDCLFISDVVHRDEFGNNSELEKLLDKYKVKVDFFQKELQW